MLFTTLLVGRGRLAQHLAYALPAVWNIPVLQWDRSQSKEDLHSKLQKADVVALAISDSAIESFHKEHRELTRKECLWAHFSGALVLPELIDLHPLMTFGPDRYEPQVYKKIPFVSASLKVWPASFTLDNPLYKIDSHEKARYHAMCVLAGNFSALLWRKAIQDFIRMGLPADIAKLYAEQNLTNVFANPDLALTGPLVRGDLITQQKNLEALSGDAYADVYKAFQQIFQMEKTHANP